MNISAEERQIAKKRQLLAVKDILDDMGIPFWLHSGTLLGYYRERDLILHDPDLDLGVMQNQIPMDFPYRLAKRLEGTGMRIGWNTPTCLKLYPEPGSPFCGSHCDIFVHKKGTHGLDLPLSTDTETVEYVHPVRGFTHVLFLGSWFSVPSNLKECIYTQYGPGWETPVQAFKWDRDPTNIVGSGRQMPVLDEHPDRDVIAEAGIDVSGDTLSLGPLTENDVNLFKNNLTVVSTQTFDMRKIKHKHFIPIHGDETHCTPDTGGPYDTVVVPHPELCNRHNLRSLLHNAWAMLKNGGRLEFAGTPPDFVEDFMFERTGERSWRKYAEHADWEKNVTAVVVTYESPDMARRCVESLNQHNPRIRVVLADNSKSPKAVPGSRLVPLPEDSGLSYSRNAGVAEAETPYVLITDDDQLMQEPDSLRKMYDSLRTNGLDIVGGDVVNSVTKAGNLYSGATITRKTRSVVLRTGHRGSYPDGTVDTDLAVNFLMAKKETFAKVGWRNELKLHEHLDFFLRAKDRGCRIGVLKSAKCLHVKGPGIRSPEYRAARGRMYRALMMRLNGLDKIDQFGTIYTYEDSTVRITSRPQVVRPVSGIRKTTDAKTPRLSLVERFPNLFSKKRP